MVYHCHGDIPLMALSSSSSRCHAGTPMALAAFLSVFIETLSRPSVRAPGAVCHTQPALRGRQGTSPCSTAPRLIRGSHATDLIPGPLAEGNFVPTYKRSSCKWSSSEVDLGAFPGL